MPENSAWDPYVHQIQNKFDASSNAWSVTDVCQSACIYGHDGTPWAASKGFFLANYDYDLEQEDGTKKRVVCNEHAGLMLAVDGNRKP